MPSLKGLLFSQYAAEGLNKLLEEMQSQYKPKKGRRFNHGNITYEISRPNLKDNCIEFEISSKIPQDELGSAEDMKTYFEGIKEILFKEKSAPVSIEMENIVWDSRRDTEKEREYVKLLYRYPLNDLFDNQEIIKQTEAGSEVKRAASTFTQQGSAVLNMVTQKILDVGRQNLESLINANKAIRAEMAN